MHWACLEASALGSLIAACPAWKRRETKITVLCCNCVRSQVTLSVAKRPFGDDFVHDDSSRVSYAEVPWQLQQLHLNPQHPLASPWMNVRLLPCPPGMHLVQPWPWACCTKIGIRYSSAHCHIKYFCCHLLIVIINVSAVFVANLSVNTNALTVVQAMASPSSSLKVCNRSWLKITIPSAFIGQLLRIIIIIIIIITII